MIWLVYNCLFPVVFLLLLPRFLLRMWKRGGYRRGFLQRLGLYAPDLEARLKSRPRLWIHAVSVGEVQVALQFLRVLREREPGSAFVVTTATSTGHALAARRLPADDVLLYFPVDIPWIVRRALNRIRPRALVLVEGELWPNLLRQARRRRIPTLLLNGRLSENSFRGYRRLRPLVRRALDCLDLCCMQGDEDARRILDLGAAPAKVAVLGSAKFDVAPAAAADRDRVLGVLSRAGFPADARWLVGGSTWPGEERLLMAAYKLVRAGDSRARLVLAPRHAERRASVLADVEAAGLACASWRELKAGAAGAPGGRDVLLVDTTGELNQFYGLAAVIFVGKSLTSRGGQNVIEPAVQGKPIVVGPHTGNFTAVIAAFRAANALVQVGDAAGLERAVLALWADEPARLALGRRAARVVRAQAGALRASADRLLALPG